MNPTMKNNALLSPPFNGRGERRKCDTAGTTFKAYSSLKVNNQSEGAQEK